MNIPHEIITEIINNMNTLDLRMIHRLDLCRFCKTAHCNIEANDTPFEVFCKLRYNPQGIQSLEQLMDETICDPRIAVLTSEEINIHMRALYKDKVIAAILALGRDYTHIDPNGEIPTMLLYMGMYNVMREYISQLTPERLRSMYINQPELRLPSSILDNYHDNYPLLDALSTSMNTCLYDILGHDESAGYIKYLAKDNILGVWNVFYKTRRLSIDDLLDYRDDTTAPWLDIIDMDDDDSPLDKGHVYDLISTLGIMDTYINPRVVLLAAYVALNILENLDVFHDIVNELLGFYGLDGYFTITQEIYDFDIWPAYPDRLYRTLALAYTLGTGVNMSNYREFDLPDIMDID